MKTAELGSPGTTICWGFSSASPAKAGSMQVPSACTSTVRSGRSLSASVRNGRRLARFDHFGDTAGC